MDLIIAIDQTLKIEEDIDIALKDRSTLKKIEKITYWYICWSRPATISNRTLILQVLQMKEIKNCLKVDRTAQKLWKL